MFLSGLTGLIRLIRLKFHGFRQFTDAKMIFQSTWLREKWASSEDGLNRSEMRRWSDLGLEKHR